MKKRVLCVVLVMGVIGLSCRMEPPPAPPQPLTLVTLGDSITMGIQDAGLLAAFQYNDFPYLIARQQGGQDEFQQPYVSAPGIGVPPYSQPLEIQNKEIIATLWPTTDPNQMLGTILSRLANAKLPAPYNNLGVNGATLYDLRHATSMDNSAGPDNYFFDIVLRNRTIPLSGIPNFGGLTAVQEAARLEPEIILLWIGNNDILGTVLVGCGTDGDNFFCTDPGDFEDEYTALLDDVTAITPKVVLANIPAYLPFANALDGTYRHVLDGPDESLSLFDPTTFAPIDFDPPNELYLPLLLEETDARHLLLTGAMGYLHLDDPAGSGLGIPDDASLQPPPYNISDPDERAAILAVLDSHDLQPSGQPLPGSTTLTPQEEADVRGVIDQLNAILTTLSATYGLPLVDIVASWWGDGPGTSNPFGGYSGLYALQAQTDTTFSLDGVHPNNLGHALCANAFIMVLNREYDLEIPLLDPNAYAGQYAGKSIQAGSLQALKGVIRMYAPRTK
jgi:hypothetical protein